MAALAAAALCRVTPSAFAQADGVRRLLDQPYGSDPRQRVDVYLPARPRGPLLLMIHGGAWMVGNKAMPTVVDGKVDHWVRERGWVVVSIGYRLVPQVRVPQQAADVARAIAWVQSQAARWGADASRLVLMGHSAGAHLAALVSSSPAIRREAGAAAWRGTVVLDSAALDTSALMSRRHLAMYDRAFGSDPDQWRAASPTDALAAAGAPPLPMLLVCSSPRLDDSCGQSLRFAARVKAAGGRAEVLPQALSHMEINGTLGRPGAYTQAVDAFVASLGLD